VSQATRNKVYGVIAGVLSILVVVGVIDEATSAEATNLANAILDQAEAILGLVAAVTAFVKSLPSRVKTVELKGKHAEV